MLPVSTSQKPRIASRTDSIANPASTQKHTLKIHRHGPRSPRFFFIAFSPRFSVLASQTETLRTLYFMNMRNTTINLIRRINCPIYRICYRYTRDLIIEIDKTYGLFIKKLEDIDDEDIHITPVFFLLPATPYTPLPILSGALSVLTQCSFPPVKLSLSRAIRQNQYDRIWRSLD